MFKCFIIKPRKNEQHSNIPVKEKVPGEYLTSNLKAEIDLMVYQLYKLTPEEIAIVEGGFEK